jgi:SnoaL-like domain
VNEHEISRLSDLLQLRALKAAYCETDAVWHSIHTPRMDVTGDTAVGRWTLIVRMRRKGSTTSDELFGRYLDEFRRTPNGWRISAVRFIQEG